MAEKVECYETRKARLREECREAFAKIFEDLFAAAEAEASSPKPSSKEASSRSSSTSEPPAVSPITPATRPSDSTATSDSTVTSEIEYNYAYSIMLFSEVAGSDFKYVDGIYVQVCGGGPEGGYVFAANGLVYYAHREWFKPFTLKRVGTRFAQSQETGYDALRFRELKRGESPFRLVEIMFDLDEFKATHQTIWEQAVANYNAVESSSDETSSSSSCSSSSSSSSSSEESVCDNQFEINKLKAKAKEIFEFFDTWKCPQCERNKLVEF
jgi:hypothetical protein